jgi:hypothetical protein
VFKRLPLPRHNRSSIAKSTLYRSVWFTRLWQTGCCEKREFWCCWSKLYQILLHSTLPLAHPESPNPNDDDDMKIRDRGSIWSITRHLPRGTVENYEKNPARTANHKAWIWIWGTRTQSGSAIHSVAASGTADIIIFHKYNLLSYCI